MSSAGPAFFSAAAGGGLPTVTWNPSDKSGAIVLSGGNLTATKTNTGGGYGAARATRSIDAATENGYYEVRIDQISASPFAMIGVAPSGLSLATYPGNSSTSWGYYAQNGNKYNNASATAYGASFTTTDVIGVAVKNGKIWWAKNNTWQNSGNPAAGTGEAYSGLTGTIFPCIALFDSAAPAAAITARFKTADFTYSPPSGFSPWGG